MEKNKIYKIDCMIGMDKLENNSVDMIITDPPYTSPTVHAFGRKKINKLSDLAIQEYYFSQIKNKFERILKPNAPVIIFCDDVYCAVLMGLFYEWQQKNIIIWDKGRIGMGNPFRKQHEFIFYANRGSIKLNKESLTHIPSIIKSPIKKQYHGAEKPVELIETLINGLTKKGDLILDPFIGSGTTAKACISSKRNYIGFELEDEYIDICNDRLKDVDGGLF